jgi:hypothetical protein
LRARLAVDVSIEHHQFAPAMLQRRIRLAG